MESGSVGNGRVEDKILSNGDDDIEFREMDV